MAKIKKILKISGGFGLALILATGLFWVFTKSANDRFLSEYEKRRSQAFYDRHGELVYLRKNSLDYYAIYDEKMPAELKKLILAKEDRLFYYHFGFNPWRLVLAFKSWLTLGKAEASSTITQQLAKLLLSQENKRTWSNKSKEFFYALVLEAHNSKEDILRMYGNSVFLGNGAQGLETASRLYFGASADRLSQAEAIEILATINNPANNHPFSRQNSAKAQYLGQILGIKSDFSSLTEAEIKKRQADFAKYVQGEAFFEWAKFLNNERISGKNYKISADQELTQKIRSIVAGNLATLATEDVANAAVVVLKIPDNQLLAVVGSPDYRADNRGAQINMAVSPRPIGSTVKPFIYLRGFQKNLRPYTLVDDKEYKYTIGTGFAFYPKNYDYAYRGRVSLHYALSNSLNVPSVKVLEYIGMNDFYDFLRRDLEMKTAQDLEKYQLAIALGGMELSLLDLSYYFTIFPQAGQLRPLNLGDIPSSLGSTKTISESKYVQLVNKVLSDRLTGVEQFGPSGNISLKYPYYAVKTGTSQEYHDSWTIGYTGDFLVGVWAGNSDNKKMKEVSGQEGAGRIWQEVMNLMLGSEYNHQTRFNFSALKEYKSPEGLSHGLAGDDFEQYQKLLLEENLIESPHDGDVFLWQAGMRIPLKSNQKVSWQADGKILNEPYFIPKSAGTYKIGASLGEKKQDIKIIIEKQK